MKKSTKETLKLILGFVILVVLGVTTISAVIAIDASKVEAASLTRGVNSYSNATVTQLRKVTKGTRLNGYEQTILDTERAYGVNALYILAVAQAETSMGNAGVGKSRNNCFGITNGSGYASYSNTGESVKAFGKLMSKYFTRGNNTLGKIARVYCPPNASYWAKSVENNINSLYKRMIG